MKKILTNKSFISIEESYKDITNWSYNLIYYTDVLNLIHSLNASAICIVVTLSTFASPYSNVTESIVTNVCIKPLRQNLENCEGMGEHISKIEIFYSKEKLS